SQPLFATSLCLDGGHQRLNAHDVHDAGEIVGEYVQRHLGGDLGQTLHQEVRRPHPHLQRGEGMFGRLATLAHGLRVLIEALLYFLQHMLMLPACDSSLLPGRTTRATGGAMRESFPARSGVLPFAGELSEAIATISTAARLIAEDLDAVERALILV